MIDVIQQFLEKEYEEAQRVHNLKLQFDRYQTMSKDLIEEFEAGTSGSTTLIVSALYTADYIITSSDVKFELEDTARRKEIIEFWSKLSLPREDIWNEVTHIVAFTYKVTSILRKRYYYMLDRGVAKHIAAALVADYYTRHLLRFVREKLSYIPLWWISTLTETALCLNIFSTTNKKWEGMQKILQSEDNGIIAQIIARRFIDETEGEPNQAVPIPYFNESTMFYYFTWKDGETKGEKFESLLPILKSSQLGKEFKKASQLLSGDYPHLLKYIRMGSRLESLSSELNFFLVHAKTETAEGWIGILSPLDDINLREIESLLKLKLEDIGALESYKNILPKIDVLTRAKEEREIIEEKMELEEKPKPVGFFAKLFSKFKKKQQPTYKKTQVKKTVPIDAWSRLILDEILLISVSGISIGLEIYDAYREDNFVISGVIESQQILDKSSAFYTEEQAPPTTFYSEAPIQFPTEFLDPVIGVLSIAKSFISQSFREKIKIIVPEEAFYENKLNPEVFRLVEFVKGEKVLIGILAEKLARTAMSVASPEPTYQRRSLTRKANEMIHARRVNNIIDAGKRTLAREINWDSVNKSFEEQPLFYEA